MVAAGDAKTGTSPRCLQLRLMLDKTKTRLVYAECDRFMADVLFSFLTTPVATLVRRTHKSSGLGCMDSLYKSVEDMPAYYFQNSNCRELLLRPRSAFGFPHNRLKLWINDVGNVYYICPSPRCPKMSMFPGVKCDCGRSLRVRVLFNMRPSVAGDHEADEVFIRKGGPTEFVVTDDLFIAPATDAIKHHLCSLAGVSTPENLFEQICLVDDDKIVQLMKSSLLSYTPLSDTFLPPEFVPKPPQWPLAFMRRHLVAKTDDFSLHSIIKKLGKDLLNGLMGERKMSITLFHDHKRVYYAGVDKNFIDLLYSFLTFPFGSIIAAFDRNSSLRCINNLHQAAKRFRSDGLFYQYEWSRNLFADSLLNPPIAIHHSGHNQLLKIGEPPFTVYRTKCKSCGETRFKHWCADCIMDTINPKFEGNQRTKEGGGYMRAEESFAITSDLVVKSIYDLAKDIYAAGFAEKTVIIGREEALKLLWASLVSEDPLTSVFHEADVTCYGKKEFLQADATYWATYYIKHV